MFRIAEQNYKLAFSRTLGEGVDPWGRRDELLALQGDGAKEAVFALAFD